MESKVERTKVKLNINHDIQGTLVMPDGNDGFVPCSQLLTEEELIRFLRIPEISKAKDYGYVIENLKRMHGLSCIHICRKPLYPLKSVLEWINQQCEKEKK